MLILVVNCGSSSLKFQVIETSREQIENNSDRSLAHGLVERIGSSDAKLTYQASGQEKKQRTQEVQDHKHAIQIAFELLTQPGGPISDPKQIEAVGHRVVHGGEAFRESVLIDDRILQQIEAVSSLAPLHNPQNLKGYYGSRELLPQAGQVAVFDTAFHQTLPPKAFLYGIPYELYTRDKLRRYGFHGTSYRYISWRYALLQNTTPESLKLIACHLGNGCSICAIDRGRSVDTSMGFTPTEGLLMGTRTGDIDPGAVLFLARNSSQEDLSSLLNHQSGLAGLTGGTSDMRDLLAKREKGDERARDAIDIFCYRLTKYIGAYTAVLGGADAILFSGGIGENSAPIREQVCAGLAAFGVALDQNANAKARGIDVRISAADSKVPVWVIATNEELLIARDTFQLVST